MGNIENIVIVGGGSAGWMTASALVKFFPNKNITLIESPSTPPIGVGESTYEGIRYFCSLLGIDNDSFFTHTDASIKVSIVFKNFYKESGEPEFQYPFGPPMLEGTKWGLQDWLIKKVMYPETPNTEYAESYFPQAHLAKHGRFSDNEHKGFNNFRPELDTALHFDAIKFGGWLKEHYAVPKGVKHILKEVSNIETNEFGISSLTLEDNSKISADLYVDCTGFSSLLIGKTLEENFVSYTHLLPNDSAWATRLSYVDKESELRPVTTCTALKNGWVWDIPLWSRLGTGYVFSSKYTSDEDALEEFKKHLMSENMKVPRTREIVDSLEYKKISMRVGIYEKTWSKNVVAIGLSAGFIEPLESNGLFTVYEFLYQLIRALSREKTTQWDVDVYNKSTKEIYDRFVNFIRIHYSLSIRDDSPYWKDNFNKTNYFDKSLLLSGNLNFIESLYESKTSKFIPFDRGGVTWISSGMDYHILDRVFTLQGELTNGMDYKKDLNMYFYELDKKRLAWENNALLSPTLYEYLKNRFYKNEH